MKLLFLLLTWTVIHRLPDPLLLIDMTGKKPLQTAAAFSVEQYLGRNFPVYATDRNAIVEATVQAAKRIDQNRECGFRDTLVANHTTLVVLANCGERRTVTVRLITKMTQPSFLCDFEIVRNETDPRKAQIRLLEFADYLSP